MLQMPEGTRAALFPQHQTMVVHIGDAHVHFAFLKAGERLPLRLENGKVAPATDANFYVIVHEGLAVRLLTQEQLTQELAAAVGTGVFWEIQATYPS